MRQRQEESLERALQPNPLRAKLLHAMLCCVTGSWTFEKGEREKVHYTI